MIIYPFRAIVPEQEFALNTDLLSQNAKYHFRTHLKNKDFKQISKEAVFVYEITTSFGVHLGFVAQTDIEEFINKNIRPHEKTLKSKEEVSKLLLLKRAAMVKPVLVCHRPNPKLSDLLKTHRDSCDAFLTIKFQQNGDIHRVWPIYDTPTLKQIQHLAGSIDHAYIADGHHRSKVLQSIHKKKNNDAPNIDKICSAYFDFNAVQILDYNRMVEIDRRISLTDFMMKLNRIFNISISKRAIKANGKHHLTMLLDGKWYSMCWKRRILQKYKKLEVILDHQVFDKEVLNEILGIKNVTIDKSITYFSGEISLENIECKLTEYPRTAAFFINPVDIAQMVQLTENDKTLPPKSTYFIPRLHNGIICDAL